MKEGQRLAVCFLTSLGVHLLWVASWQGKGTAEALEMIPVSAVIVETDSVLDAEEERAEISGSRAPEPPVETPIPRADPPMLEALSPVVLPKVDSLPTPPELPPLPKPPAPQPPPVVAVQPPKPKPPVPTEKPSSAPAPVKSSPPKTAFSPRVSAPPQAPNRIIIRYPRSARERRHEGTVRLEARILSDGRCGRVTILETSGHPELDEAAAAAFRKANFIPARAGDCPVEASVRQTITFRLSGIEIAK
ncbi:MAG: TonB family protein [Kiritimatiellia bacterium]